MEKKVIIFFDGVCGMCNQSVDFVIRFDKKNQFLFAPIQGTTAQEHLDKLPDDPKLWSMVLMDEEKIQYIGADAVLEIYRRLGGIWRVFSLARFIPRGIRNPIYRFIARNRYRIAGKKETCRLVSPEERQLFLP